MNNQIVDFERKKLNILHSLPVGIFSKKGKTPLENAIRDSSLSKLEGLFNRKPNINTDTKKSFEN
jgi:hypothetical protein